MQYYDRMTAEQQAVVDNFRFTVDEEVLACLDCLYEIDKIGYRGHVSLPAISASREPVLHGANLTIFALRSYYLKRIALVRLMDRETYDKWVPEFYKSESSRVGI